MENEKLTPEERMNMIVEAIRDQQRSIDLLKRTVGMIYAKAEKSGLLKPETKAEFSTVLTELGISVL